MSDNIPFEIQTEIIKKLPLKSLIQFRSVSKTWNSTITYKFIITHTPQHTQTKNHHLLVKYDEKHNSDKTCLLFSDNETFPRHKISITVPHLLNMIKYYCFIGSSQGLFCFYSGFEVSMVVVWNLYIRKTVGVVVPNVEHDGMYSTVLGFGVCPESDDVKIVKINHVDDWNDRRYKVGNVRSIPWHVEVFTLSTGVWRSPLRGFPRKTIKFGNDSVVIDGVLYWLATEWYNTPQGYDYYNLIVTFDLTSEKFGEIRLSDKLARLDYYYVSIGKMGECLVVVESFRDDTGFSVWMMRKGGSLSSFTKSFSVTRPEASLKGFRKNGEPIVEGVVEKGSTLHAYNFLSKVNKRLEISESARWIKVYPYVESLLLLDQQDSVIYENGKATLLNEDMQKGFEALLL